MIRREDVTFIDSLSEPVIQNVAVISERVIAENEGAGSVSFTVAKESIEQEVNADSARVFECYFGKELTDNELEWLSTASFIEVVERYALTIGGDA
ncbi:hypothetical protein H9655_21160 [Cytobacillus sp. Sa5YUA1]|uniref:Uncharacterized protein n=1 Tax=Cytobacillus stercorigallinarum TaxID=2762240 RepID=A0ABR8QVI8_9BACI|nr:hypothetical protein [Cytobacillus stercorigallinarum]MBD7939556.1 hypothetical protein [Cytobacillus stercorigallinarum]